jgi:hypothetical protein
VGGGGGVKIKEWISKTITKKGLRIGGLRVVIVAMKCVESSVSESDS